MTPAVQALQRAKVEYTIHKYDHDPNCAAYGEEAAEKMGMDPARVFKTLVTQLEGSTLVVGIVPVTGKLDLKALAKIFKAKKAGMADKKLVEKTTGYIVGGVSPLGQKKRLKTIIDKSAQEFTTIFVSGGRRGLDIELSADTLAELTSAVFATISR